MPESRRVLWVLVILVTVALALVLSRSARAHYLGTDRYDAEIRSASERWLPTADWRRYRALLYQESRLDPDAVSPAGAEGIAQFMPGTWRDQAPALGYGLLTPRHARAAIDVGAFYLASRVRFWTEPRPFLERRRKGEACYNAGCGHVLSAQRLCRAATPCPCLAWGEVELFLELVTGRHAAETRDYVRKIEHWYAVMVAARS